MKDVEKIISEIKGADISAVEKAQIRQDNLLKPKGSLGTLEKISVKLAGITGKINNSADKRIVFLFGADNGINE